LIDGGSDLLTASVLGTETKLKSRLQHYRKAVTHTASTGERCARELGTCRGHGCARKLRSEIQTPVGNNGVLIIAAHGTP